MDGYIKIVCEGDPDGNRVHVKCHLDRVGHEDISQLIYLTFKAVGVEPEDYWGYFLEAEKIATAQGRKAKEVAE